VIYKRGRLQRIAAVSILSVGLRALPSRSWTIFSWPPKRGRLQHVAVFSTLSVDLRAIAEEQLDDLPVAIK